MNLSEANFASDQVQSLSSSLADRDSRQVFYGWWVVFASAVGLFWTVPISVYAFPVFMKPLMQEFHAGRAAVSLSVTLQLSAGVVTAPILGWLLDRYSARRVILIGTSIFGVILLANREFVGGIGQIYMFYIALGISLHGGGPIPYGSVVCRWFDRQRGLALGLMMLGLGLGAMLMPPIAQQLISRFGWRTAYMVLGGAVLIVTLPTVTAFLKGRPQELGLLPDGIAQHTAGTRSAAAEQGVNAREAWRSGTFWLMACGFFLVSASAQGCVVHLAAMLGDHGMTAQTAALGSSVIGAAVLIGRVGSGYLLDRIFGPRVAAVFFVGAVLGIALLLSGTARLAFAGAFLVGLGLGAEVDVIAYLAGRYFGLRAFGKIYSSLFALFALGAALGPLVMGVGFDKTGSYTPPLIGFLVATLLATVLMTRLGAYRFRPPERSVAPMMTSENSREALTVQPEKQHL
jgi:MFS family permease